jgi:hypothetical protein|tara:strand:+ start:171 stop:425 length:255 start_codon:yes stop_codon:yes gene_type:complete
MGRKKKQERFDTGGYYADRRENAGKAASKIDKLNAKANLATAKASKRKWLAVLLGFGIAIYFIFSSGSGLSVLNSIKSFLPSGD